MQAGNCHAQLLFAENMYKSVSASHTWLALCVCDMGRGKHTKVTRRTHDYHAMNFTSGTRVRCVEACDNSHILLERQHAQGA